LISTRSIPTGLESLAAANTSAVSNIGRPRPNPTFVKPFQPPTKVGPVITRPQPSTLAVPAMSSAKDNMQTPPPPLSQRKYDDVGPWSREAYDIFDWIPPNRRLPKDGRDGGEGNLVS
jgi:hypothetical protein